MLEVAGLTKRFGAVVACDRVDLALHAGRIHGILGENGAGKSTLMKALIGLVIPDAGEIRRNGESIQIKDPVDAAAHGIGMVHQHFSLVEALLLRPLPVRQPGQLIYLAFPTDDPERPESDTFSDPVFTSLRDAARGTENVFPHILDCARAYCTLFEIRRALEDVFGAYREPVFF